MTTLHRLVLDVLKPHLPTGLDFARNLAELAPGYRIKYKVEEVDEKTETVTIVIEGEDIDYDAVKDAITSMGASLHSVDEVEVSNP